eukprot:TRINITY_DN4637_c0_g1_i2.p1 TRINITY_DN4637_c0_g1~~TRINITY_DN4637_c0_g1_i2.p1  ORF type:complete len:926 (-),score=172.46 TRINITY_DN4637_c0_g1_i2:118-2895(-)
MLELVDPIRESNNDSHKFMNDLWVYDQTGEVWFAPALTGSIELPEPRIHHTLTWVSDTGLDGLGYYILVGGQAVNGSVLSDVWLLDLKWNEDQSTRVCTASWKLLQPTKTGNSYSTERFGHAAVSSKLNKPTPFVVLFMGVDNQTSTRSDITELTIYAATGEYDSVGVTETREPRCFHTVEINEGTEIFFYMYGGLKNYSDPDSTSNNLDYFVNQHSSIVPINDKKLTSFTQPGMPGRARHTSVTIAERWFHPPSLSNNTQDSHHKHQEKDSCFGCPVMLVFGGQSNSTAFLADLWGYRNFTAANRLFVAFRSSRAASQAFLMSTEGDPHTKLHVIGGVSNDNGTFPGSNIVSSDQDIFLNVTFGPNTSVARLQPSPSFHPSAAPSANAAVAALRDFSLVTLPNRSLIVHGGRSIPSDQSEYLVNETQGVSGNTYIFNRNESSDFGGEWQLLTTTIDPVSAELCPPLLARFSHCAVVWNNVMITFGGATGLSQDSHGTNTMWMLDLETRQWRNPIPNTTVGQLSLFGHSCTVTSEGMVVAGGVQVTDPGQGSGGQVPPDTSYWHWNSYWYIFNFSDYSWVNHVETQNIAFHTSATGPNNTVLTFGGVTSNSEGDLSPLNPTIYACNLDENNTCVPSSNSPDSNGPPVFQHSMHSWQHTNTSLNNLKAFIYGGVNSDWEINDQLYHAEIEFSPPTPPTPVPPSPSPPSPSPPSPSPSHNSSTPISLIIAAVVVVCVIIVVAGGFTIVYYRRNAKKIQEFQESLQQMHPDTDQSDLHTEAWGKPRENPEDYRNWEQEFGKRLIQAPDFVIKFEELRMVKQIGHGSSCVVHVGWWKDSPVAVKRFFLHRNYTPEDFYRETLVHKQLKHKNVLEMLAISINPPCSVTPLMRYGSLFHILQSGQELSYTHILQIAMDTCLLYTSPSPRDS